MENPKIENPKIETITAEKSVSDVASQILSGFEELEKAHSDISQHLGLHAITNDLIGIQKSGNFNFSQVDRLYSSSFSFLKDYLDFDNLELSTRALFHKIILNLTEFVFRDLFEYMYKDYVYFRLFIEIDFYLQIQDISKYSHYKDYLLNFSRLAAVISTEYLVCMPDTIDFEVLSEIKLNQAKLLVFDEAIGELKSLIVSLQLQGLSALDAIKSSLETILVGKSIDKEDIGLILDIFDKMINHDKSILQAKNAMIDGFEKLRRSIPYPQKTDINKLKQQVAMTGSQEPVEKIMERERVNTWLMNRNYPRQVKSVVRGILIASYESGLKFDWRMKSPEFQYIGNLVEKYGINANNRFSDWRFILQLPNIVEDVIGFYGLDAAMEVLNKDVFPNIFEVVIPNLSYGFPSHLGQKIIPQNGHNWDISPEDVEYFVSKDNELKERKKKEEGDAYHSPATHRVPSADIDRKFIPPVSGSDDISQYNDPENINPNFAEYAGPGKAPNLYNSTFTVDLDGQCKVLKMDGLTTVVSYCDEGDTWLWPNQGEVQFTERVCYLPVPVGFTNIKVVYVGEKDVRYSVSFAESGSFGRGINPVSVTLESFVPRPSIVGNISSRQYNLGELVWSQSKKHPSLRQLNAIEFRQRLLDASLPQGFVNELLKYRETINTRFVNQAISDIHNITQKHLQISYGFNQSYVGNNIVEEFDNISKRVFIDGQPILCLEITYFMGYIFLQSGFDVAIQAVFIPEDKNYSSDAHTYLIINGVEYDPVVLLSGGVPKNLIDNAQSLINKIFTNKNNSSEQPKNNSKLKSVKKRGDQFLPPTPETIGEEVKIEYVPDINISADYQVGYIQLTNNLKVLNLPQDWNNFEEFSVQNLKDIFIVLQLVDYARGSSNIMAYNSPLLKENVDNYFPEVMGITTKNHLIPEIQKILYTIYSDTTEDIFYNSAIKISDDEVFKVKTGEKPVAKIATKHFINSKNEKQEYHPDLELVRERIKYVLDIQKMIRKSPNPSKYYRLTDKTVEYITNLDKVLDLLS